MAYYEYAGRIAFANIQGIEQFTFTRSRGVQPSVMQFVTPILPQVGVGETVTLLMSDGANQITFRECAIQAIEGDYSDGKRFTVSAMDRRWKWAYGQVSGKYNVVRGGTIVNSTKKNARELAEILLREMGEENYDTSLMPTDSYPEVDWDLEIPAVALETLVSHLGGCVCLQLDNSVKLCKVGVGEKLPYIPGCEMRDSIKVSTIPDAIYVSASPTIWEVSIKIDKPFGIERTKPGAGKVSIESVVPIDTLTYKPDNGWGNEDPEYFANVAKKIGAGMELRQAIRERDRIRGLAQESVWKLYGFKFPITLPGFGQVEDINQLEFLDELVTLTTIEYSSPLQKRTYETRRAAPFVYGVYYDRKETGKNNVEKFSHDWHLDEKLVYRGGFSVDKERGVIAFSDHAYLYDSSPDAKSRFKTPYLYLRVAVNVRDPKTGELFREVWQAPTGGKNSTKPKWVRRGDLRNEINIDPKTGKAYLKEGDNKSDVDKELRKQAEIENAKLAALNPASATYNGFVKIDLDGTIEQVSYEIDGSGITTTTASYGYEHSYVVPSYEERRRVALLEIFSRKQAALMTGAPKDGGG